MRILVLPILSAACVADGLVRHPGDDAPPDTGVEDTSAADTDTGGGAPPVAFNGCTAPDGERAAGTWSDPVALLPPFSDAADTTGLPSAVDAYDCAPDKPEAGGEVVYNVAIEVAGTLRAVLVEADGVDVDLHLRRAGECLVRANTTLEHPVEPGDYELIVDTYGAAGATAPGRYELFVTAWPEDEWAEVALGVGTWRHLEGSGRRFDALVVDPERVRPALHDGCEPVPDVLSATGARAGINGGFFDACAPLDFVRADGVTLARVTASFSSAQRVVGWDARGATTAWVARDEDWTLRDDAVGSWPSLVEGGLARLDPDRDSTFYDARHPRTALGIDGLGRLLLFTADGRSTVADGLRLDELADVMVDLGAVDAVNLDGGGSTTMAIGGCGPGGVVNRPSDGHPRAVSDGLYVD